MSTKLDDRLKALAILAEDLSAAVFWAALKCKCGRFCKSYSIHSASDARNCAARRAYYDGWAIKDGKPMCPKCWTKQ